MPVQVLVGNEVAALAQLAKSKVSVWLSLQGARLTHASLGHGEVTQVRTRLTASPLIDVQFEQHGAKTFNDEAFLSGLITAIAVEIGVAAGFEDWIRQFEYRKAIEQISLRLVSERPRLKRRPPQVTPPNDIMLCFVWSNIGVYCGTQTSRGSLRSIETCFRAPSRVRSRPLLRRAWVSGQGCFYQSANGST
jgi:hypothetical protein